MRLGATAIPGTAALTAQITAIFQQYFGRAPLAAGLAFWQNAVTSGQVDDANLALQIVLDAAPPDKTYFQTNYPQIAAQVYGVQNTPAGSTPSNAPVVTNTQATSATVADQQTAVTTAPTSSLFSSPLVIGALALGAYLMLEKK
jgi:hypothetical protein